MLILLVVMQVVGAISQNVSFSLLLSLTCVCIVVTFLFVTNRQKTPRFNPINDEQSSPTRPIPHSISDPNTRFAPMIVSKPGRTFTLILAGSLSLFAILLAGDQPMMKHPALAVSAWLGSIVLVVWAALASMAHAGKPGIKLQNLFPVLFVILIGIMIRFYQINRWPVQVTGDEARFALIGMDALAGRVNNIFILSANKYPLSFSLLQALSVSIFGQTDLAIRFFPALLGGLTVGVVHMLASKLFDRWTAFIAALLMAGQHVHLHFSRMGLNNIVDALMFPLVVNVLLTACKNNRRSAWVMTGLLLGASQYFYLSAKFLVVLVVGWSILWIVLNPSDKKQKWFNLLWMLLAAFTVYAPLLVYTVSHAGDFLVLLSRVRPSPEVYQYQIQLEGGNVMMFWLKKLWTAAMGFTSTPLLNWYWPDVPLMRFPSAIFFMIGVTSLISPRFSRQAGFLFIWLAGFIIIGALSDNTPAAQRYLAATPAAAILIAKGILHMRDLFLRVSFMHMPARSTRMTIVVLILSGVLMLDDVLFYFKDYSPKSIYIDSHNAALNQLGIELQAAPAECSIYFMGDETHQIKTIPQIEYYLRDRENVYDIPHQPVNSIFISSNRGCVWWAVLENAGLNPATQAALEIHCGEIQSVRMFSGEVVANIYRFNSP